MKTKTLLLAILILVLPSVSYGQLGGMLRRAASKVTNTIGKESTKEANRQADSIAQLKAQQAANKAIENNTQNNPADNQANQNTNQGNNRRGSFNIGNMLGGADIKHSDEYSFDGRMYMQMEMYDKKEPMKSDYYIYFNQVNSNAGIEFRTVAKQGDNSTPVATVMVYDNDNRCFMMLIDKGGQGQKTGIISTIPSDSALKARAADRQNGEVKPADIAKTGRSRVIAGYKCDEYKITETDKKGYALVWMTKDLKLKTNSKNWGKAGIPSYQGYTGFENSSMLAMESYDETSKLTMKMETVEINPNYSHKISVTGYSFIKMNFNQMGGPQKK
ncbi:MAG TPA: DUF4412 domain-containing protein [Bacteroidales bacterium]|nr:DUF4412 domain-containing protein [Bacteroidales bacterium]